MGTPTFAPYLTKANTQILAARHPGETVCSITTALTPVRAFAACGSPYLSMLRFFGQFFVKSEAQISRIADLVALSAPEGRGSMEGAETKLDVLRMHIQPRERLQIIGIVILNPIWC